MPAMEDGAGTVERGSAAAPGRALVPGPQVAEPPDEDNELPTFDMGLDLGVRVGGILRPNTTKRSRRSRRE
jgi:hypothetical protein